LIRLTELSDFARKQLARKRKFYMVNESTEVAIPMSLDQIKRFDSFLKKVGGDVNLLLSSDLEEARKQTPEYTKMSSKEIEELNVVLKIDESVLSGVEEFVRLGDAAKGWYSEMNEKILKAFGDSEGTLFLILLAIYSAGTPLEMNLRLAAQTYQGIMKDISDPKTKELFEQFLDTPKSDSFETIYVPATKDQIKKGKTGDQPKEVIKQEWQKLSTVKGLVRGNIGVQKNYGNLINILKMWKNNNYQFDRNFVVKELAKYHKLSGDLAKGVPVSATKVFSFTLNLLDPKFVFDTGWVPVTMDTWMAKIYYPNLSTKERRSILSKPAGYALMARKTQELASQYGMEPNEFQAAVWVGILKKEKGEGYNATFENAIESRLKKLKVKIEELKNMDNFLKTVIGIIGDAGIN
jgi:hypothetical protein